MTTNAKTGAGWAWLAVVLAGLFPFASDLSRNFQLFSVRQLILTVGVVGAGTSGLFALTWLGVELVEAAVRRAGREPRGWIANGVFSLVVAGIFAVFLYDANMTELRQGFGLSRMAAAVGVCALFAVYVAVAAVLRPKRVCALLMAALVFRLAQAGWAVSDAVTRGDELMSPGEIRVYQGVKFSRTPNIYFLSLESYHGFGAMEELYGFDNGEFRGFLGTNGFSVAGETYANYWHTMSSLHSFMRMGHHYAAGTFGNHDSLFARGFISGSGTYYNPVLNILKRNGYSIVYLLPSDYYYRPGAGLVDVSLLGRSWPLAPLKLSLPRFIGREPDTMVEDYEWKVGETISTWPSGKPAFFFVKLGAEHSARIYDYRTDRGQFAARYVRAVEQANPQIEALCRQIMEKDPGGIIILAGDHGAQSYKVSKRAFQQTMREDGVPTDRMAHDLHEVLLAVRWGTEMEAADYPFRSLANVMRYVFYRLSGDKALLGTAVPDDSYLVENGFLYQTVADGHPLKEWKQVRRGSGSEL